MQAPTHILSGVLINKLFQWKRYRGIAFILMAFTCLLVHGLLDMLARFTYNPAEFSITDPFWLGYHIVVVLVSIVFLYLWWGEFKWGIIFSLLPDLEWLIIGGQRLTNKEFIYYSKPYLHNAINSMYNLLQAQSIPDFSPMPVACLVEVGVIVLLILLIRAIFNQRRNIHF